MKKIEPAKKEEKPSFRDMFPPVESSSFGHELYSGHTKDWTEGYRTGYNIASETAIALAEEYFGKEQDNGKRG